MSLTELSARDQLAGLAVGDFSAVDLMQATLARIEAVNPKVNAIVSLITWRRLALRVVRQ